MKSLKMDQKQSPLQIIETYYPQVYDAYEATRVLLALEDDHYSNLYFNPKINISYNEGDIYQNFPEIMIDFSSSCAFFLKNFHPFKNFKYKNKQITFSSITIDDFDYPTLFTLDEIGIWMPQIVYKNYLYELKSKGV